MAPRRPEQYELESLLHDLEDRGFLTISRSKLLRLLGKGNEAAGTWSALLEAWEGIEGDPSQLFIRRLMPQNEFLLMNVKPSRLKDGPPP